MRGCKVVRTSSTTASSLVIFFSFWQTYLWQSAELQLPSPLLLCTPTPTYERIVEGKALTLIHTWDTKTAYETHNSCGLLTSRSQSYSQKMHNLSNVQEDLTMIHSATVPIKTDLDTKAQQFGRTTRHEFIPTPSRWAEISPNGPSLIYNTGYWYEY